MRSIANGTSQEEQHKVVVEIFNLFGDEPDEVLLSSELWTDLRAAIDRCVHFYFYVSEWLGETIEPGDEVDWIRDDVRAGVDLFESVRFGASSDLKARIADFTWTCYPTFEDLRRDYLSWFERLCDPSIGRLERYYSLLVLSKLQVVFLGTTTI